MNKHYLRLFINCPFYTITCLYYQQLSFSVVTRISESPPLPKDYPCLFPCHLKRPSFSIPACHIIHPPIHPSAHSVKCLRTAHHDERCVPNARDAGPPQASPSSTTLIYSRITLGPTYSCVHGSSVLLPVTLLSF